jgi:predicted DNA binding CopG/RHH family protein
MNNKYKLTEEEKKIEDELENYKAVKGKNRERIEKIIANAKKNKAISLRMTNFDLEKIKEKAEEEGIPYQTLITNILHKYITNQLFDKEEMLKSIRLLKEERAI